jgi:Phage tail protein (Tail_P2_I)
MSSIKEAWDTERPIYKRLPNRNGGYENEVTDWLTGYWDEISVNARSLSESLLNKQYNPLICDPEWLDYLAVLYGWDKKHWQKNWKIESKRLLLSRSLDYIWENKGNKDVLVYVLNSLFIKNRVLEVGSFIIGTSTVGQPIGSSPWEFSVILPTAYINSDVLPLVKFIVERFSPCWCEVTYFYDDSPFQNVELLEVRDQVALGTNSTTGIQI